jgi:hypothetical protein
MRTLGFLFVHLYYAQFKPDFTVILSYIFAPSTVDVSHRQNSPTGTSRNGSGVQDRDREWPCVFFPQSPQSAAFILRRDKHFLFPVDTILFPALSAILSILSPSSDSLLFCVR